MDVVQYEKMLSRLYQQRISGLNTMDDLERDKFLKEEYFKLQDQYEDYDRRSLTIKGWVSAGSAAALVTASQNRSGYNGYLLLFGTMLFSCCFWYLETRWKTFQYATQPRIKEIESHFRGEISLEVPLQIFSKWNTAYIPLKTWSAFAHAGLQDFVIFPYLLIEILCLASLIFSLPFFY